MAELPILSITYVKQRQMFASLYVYRLEKLKTDSLIPITQKEGTF